jgi:TPR repeat protein
VSATLALPPVPLVRMRMAVAWMAALVFGLGAVAVARVATATLPARTPLAELAYYPSGQALRPASLGHAETAADLAWLRAVQYYGEHRQTDVRFVQLEHVFNVLTSLAPGFQGPYVFGAFALAQEGRDFPAAERLMLKGIEANPRSGRLAFELGFLNFVRPGGRDLKQAAEWFERAARLPGGPPNARRFAAFARQQSGDLAVALLLWDDVRRTSSNPLMRDMAEREMARLQDALRTGRSGSAMRPLSTPVVIVK